MPDIKIPSVDINKAAADLNNAVKDGAYVAVGLGVLGFQRAQVQRVELTKALEAQLSQLSTLPNSFNSQFETYVATAREQAETARTQVAAQLTELSKALEEAFAPVRTQIAKALPVDLPDLPKLPDLGEQLTAAGERFETQLESIRTQLTELAKAIDERVSPARAQFDGQLDRIEERLPAAARNVVQSVRAAASTQEQVVRSAVGLD
jgi:ElaB/YqjD/DUF883 family membrane-anchored ribosome-binding protein